MSKDSECVKVVVRCRPFTDNEAANNYKRVVDMDSLRGVVMLTNPKGMSDEVKREFTFDAIYDWNSKQMDLYDETFRPIVDAVVQGYNGTVFAYGQTGTGKTFTMEGVRNDPELRGVIPNSFDHIFTHISRTEHEHYLVRASYLEIYLEDIRDLLSKDHSKKLDLKEKPDTGVYVKDLSSFVAKSVKEIEHVMQVGNKNRSVGRTAMNEHSSRSHAIFIVTVECASMGQDGENHIRAGKLNLVDLAGSERQSKTDSVGDRFKEATKINLSLSSLGNVISALVDGKSSHIPYRDSKLTRLLQDSLGGNAKTVMVANVGPADYNYEETLTTLRYANRAKNITNKPRINEDPKDALLREYQDEISRLKSMLGQKKMKKGKKHKLGSASSEGGSSDESESDVEKVKRRESYIKARQKVLEEEKKAVMQNTELLDEEREKLLHEVHSRESLLQKEKKKREQLASKIKAMEGKLLGGNIKDRTDESKKALEKKRQEVIEQKRREREIRQELEKKEESTLEMKETFSSLQEEIDIKTKKLNKVKAKLKSARNEIADYKDEQIKLREELASTISSLQQEQKLRSLIIDNFIPPEEADKVVRRAIYKEDEEEWILTPFLSATESFGHVRRPISNKGSLYPITVFAKVAARSGDPRFMADNILKIELEMPNRATQDFEAPSMSSKMKAILDATMCEDEEEVIVDARNCIMSASDLVPPDMSKKVKKSSKSRQPSTGSIHKSKRSSEHITKPDATTSDNSQQQGVASNFPTSRGLVSKPVRFA